jgi:hypothetical protein
VALPSSHRHRHPERACKQPGVSASHRWGEGRRNGKGRKREEKKNAYACCLDDSSASSTLSSSSVFSARSFLSRSISLFAWTSLDFSAFTSLAALAVGDVVGDDPVADLNPAFSRSSSATCSLNAASPPPGALLASFASASLSFAFTRASSTASGFAAEELLLGFREVSSSESEESADERNSMRSSIALRHSSSGGSSLAGISPAPLPVNPLFSLRHH